MVEHVWDMIKSLGLQALVYCSVNSYAYCTKLLIKYMLDLWHSYLLYFNESVVH